MKMEKLIACCGWDCATCEARIATMTNNDELRAKKAAEWRIQYNSPNISTEMINCTGCREPGAKLGHCEHCEIKNCVLSKNFQSCAECDKLENCPAVKKVHQYAPETLENLKGSK